MNARECMNCGIAIDEHPGDDMYDIQMAYYAEETGGSFCEACYFDGYDETGAELAAGLLARNEGEDGIAEALCEMYTAAELRSECSLFGIARPRGATKAETAELLASRKTRLYAKKILTSR